MATGKTPAHYSQVLIAGYDLSGDGHAYSAGVSFPEVDGTGLSALQKGVMAGQPAITLNLKAWFNNATANGSHTILKSAGVSRIVSIPIGMRAAPVAGDICFAAQLQQSALISEVTLGQAVGLEVPFASAVAGGTAPVIGTPWGVVLHPNSQETATANGTTIDQLAGTTAGAHGYLHVTAAGGSWAIIVQHDTASNMLTATTLMTFSSNGSAITAEKQTATGTVNRYVRVRAVRTSGNLDYFMAFVRG